MSSPLERLPLELLEDIVMRVRGVMHTDDGDRVHRAMHRLCLTCRTLYDAAVPQLYRTLDLRVHKSNKGSFRSLLLTLQRNPGLAKLVRGLCLPFEDRKTPVSYHDQDTLRATAWDLCGTPFHGTMVHALSNGCHTAEALSILLATKHLRKLTLRFGSDHNDEPAEDMGRQHVSDGFETDELGCESCPSARDIIRNVFSSGRLHTAYKQITKLWVYASDPTNLYHGTPIQNISPCLGLPAVQHLGLLGFESSAPLVKSQECRNFFSRLTSLLLVRCNISTRDTIEMLNECHGLVEFESSLTVFQDPHRVYENPIYGYDVDLPKLFVALKQHKNSLEVLRIHNLDDWGTAFDHQLAANFVEFSSLQVLEIEIDILLNSPGYWRGSGFDVMDLHRVFPPSLRRLTLHTRRDLELVLPAVCRALGRWQSEILREVEVTFEIGTQEDGRPDWSKLFYTADDEPTTTCFGIAVYADWYQRLYFRVKLDTDGVVANELLQPFHRYGDTPLYYCPYDENDLIMKEIVEPALEAAKQEPGHQLEWSTDTKVRMF